MKRGLTQIPVQFVITMDLHEGKTSSEKHAAISFIKEDIPYS
jgi:hypothetical protein